MDLKKIVATVVLLAGAGPAGGVAWAWNAPTPEPDVVALMDMGLDTWGAASVSRPSARCAST